MMWPFDGNGTAVEDVASAKSGYHDRKFDQGKVDFSLLPFAAVSEVAEFAADDSNFAQTNTSSALDATDWLSWFEASGDRDGLLGACLAFDVELPVLLEEVVFVLEYGAKKYARDSWREVPDALRRYLNAAWRHLAALARGEERDPESGLPHRGHFLTNILFCVELSR